jgi:hypothetical protein
MKGKTVIDGRNIYNPTDLAETQLELHAIGRK